MYLLIFGGNLLSFGVIFIFLQSINLKKTGISGIFAASLDLTKEGLIEIMQKKSFDKLLVKEKK